MKQVLYFKYNVTQMAIDNPYTGTYHLHLSTVPGTVRYV